MLDFIKRIRFWWNYRQLPHPASREFLQTYEWARVRYQVLLKYRDKPCMAQIPRQAVHGARPLAKAGRVAEC
jgi:hypothetical protein